MITKELSNDRNYIFNEYILFSIYYALVQKAYSKTQLAVSALASKPAPSFIGKKQNSPGLNLAYCTLAVVWSTTK